jgi:hypothetical protein
LINAIQLPLLGTAIFTLIIFIFQKLSHHLFSGQSLMSLFCIVFPATLSYIITIYLHQPETLTEIKNMVVSSLRQKESTCYE